MSTGIRNARTLFLEAVEHHPPEQWALFVDSACSADDELRRKVLQLLDAHATASSFMAVPAGGMPTLLSPIPAEGTVAPPIGAKIGRYKLLEQIGEGGMGIVYVAEQTEPVRRKVALKIIKPGMDSREVISRFEVERQALAIMDHPNIARVLDAGTTEAGRPYFVMELVRGMPVTDYCDKAKLTVRQRLGLFVTVCQAVQHAHLKGIIHRDLKPGNVMITLHDGSPVVKVIDFGVAKAMNQQFSQHSVYTAFSQIIGTPLYMSPEQAEMSGLDIDTRSDVYSLGVLLYELLTGQTPFDRESFGKAGIDEMRRMIREDEPARPSRRLNTLGAQAISTLSQQRGIDERRLKQALRSELDWIVMKAIEKDRTRRYESASAFAADVQRYLDDESVQACPPSTVYRLRKFGRKHKVTVFTSGVVAVALLVGTAVAMWQAIDARAARERADEHAARAERSFRKSLEAVDRMLTRVGDTRLAGIPEAAPIRQELFQDAMEFYGGFLTDHAADPQLRLEVARVWNRKANLHDLLGQWSECQQSRQTAMQLLHALHDERPDDAASLETLADATAAFGGVEYWILFHTSTAERAFLQAIEYRRELARRVSDNAEHRLAAAAIETSLGSLYAFTKRYPEAERTLQSAVDAQTSLLTAASPCSRHMEACESTIHLAGLKGGALEDARAAEVLFQQALAHGERAAAKDPHGTETPMLRSLSLLRYGELLVGLNRPQEAEDYFRRAVDLAEPAVRNKLHRASEKHWLQWSQQALALLLVRQGRTAELPQLITDPTQLAKLYEQSGDGSAATTLFAEELEVAEKLHAIEPHNADLRQRLGKACFAYGDWRYHRGEHDMAFPLLNRALEILPDDSEALDHRGQILLERGEWEAAITDFDESIEHGAKYGASTLGHRALARFRLAQYPRALVDFAEVARSAPTRIHEWGQLDPAQAAACADEAFRTGYLNVVNAVIQEHPSNTEARITRAVFLTDIGRREQAKADLAVAAAQNDGPYRPRFLAGLLALRCDDQTIYREICRSSLKQFANSQDAQTCHFIAWTAAAAPQALQDYEPAITLSQRSVNLKPHDHQMLVGLAAVLYRSGRFAEALEQLTVANDVPVEASSSPAYRSYFQAMTHHQLGQTDDARRFWEQAKRESRQELDNVGAPPTWSHRLTLELLDAEAGSLLRSDSETSPPVE